MSTFRDLTLACALTGAALALIVAPPAAGQGDEPTAVSAAQPRPKTPEPARPLKPSAPMGAQADGGADSLVRPASAFPPERIQADPPGDVDKAAPMDDPRSVEAVKPDPDADVTSDRR